MPLITIEGPVLADLAKKRDLVREFTDVAARAYGFPKEHFVVIIKENPPENIGVGGELIRDRG